MLKKPLTGLICTVSVFLSVSDYAQSPGAAPDCAAQATEKSCMRLGDDLMLSPKRAAAAERECVKLRQRRLPGSRILCLDCPPHQGECLGNHHSHFS